MLGARFGSVLLGRRLAPGRLPVEMELRFRHATKGDIDSPTRKGGKQSKQEKKAEGRGLSPRHVSLAERVVFRAGGSESDAGEDANGVLEQVQVQGHLGRSPGT